MTSPVVTVRPGDSVMEVIRKMAEHSLSGLVVVDAEDRPCGMVSESDLLYRVAHPHLPPVISILGSVLVPGAAGFNEALRKMTAVTAADLMTGKVYTVTRDTPVADLADLMLEQKIRRVPVVDDEERLIGLVTRGDLVRRFLTLEV
ncbi:MAG: CBS domain-containing protein [Candidatus Eremiobacterota bacterium]